ncbi:hypothetical protein ACVK00_000678 [Burkholderia sp. PvR073]
MRAAWARGSIRWPAKASRSARCTRRAPSCAGATPTAATTRICSPPGHHVFRNDADARRVAIALGKRFIDMKLTGLLMPMPTG